MIKNLTDKQKIQLLVGKGVWQTHDADGNVRTILVSDGPMGVRQPSLDNIGAGDMPSIAYPSAQTLSFTWNVELARKTGNAIANDCIERNMDILLAPGVNIKRVPICGRNFEYLSEDPFLAGSFAREYIVGVQEKHIGTSLKHYCANNIEYARNWISSDIDERTLREIYLTAFEMACQSKPWTVMCAYNLVNGVRMSEHKELYTVLRNEFGFDGAIISDWGAVQDRIASLNAGLDLEMPENCEHEQQLLTAYENGTLDMQKVDESAMRMVELAAKCENASKIRKEDMSIAEREQCARTVAEQGIVLLKNEGILPLDVNDKIMVTGAPLNFYYFGGGSSQVKLRNKYVNLQQTLSEYCSKVTYAETVMCSRGHCSDIGNIPGAIKVAKTMDVSIVCVGNNDACESESFDRQHISLSREENDTIQAIASVSKKTIVIVYAGCTIDMTPWIDMVDAVVWAGYGGEFVNYALADILVGKVNPSGKLTETMPLSMIDVPAMNSYRDQERLIYQEGLNVGYRYFETFDKPVLFPFGYGLSYSTFVYSNLQVKGNGCNLTVTVDVENTSSVDGKEIVQLYIHQQNPQVYRPLRELKGFAKVDVPAGKKVQATMTLNERSFAYYSTDAKGWVVDDDEFEIQIGSNVHDIHLVQKVKVK